MVLASSLSGSASTALSSSGGGWRRGEGKSCDVNLISMQKPREDREARLVLPPPRPPPHHASKVRGGGGMRPGLLFILQYCIQAEREREDGGQYSTARIYLDAY